MSIFLFNYVNIMHLYISYFYIVYCEDKIMLFHHLHMVKIFH